MSTQGEILFDVRSRLNEATPAQWTDKEIFNWINQAQQEIARSAECIRAETTVSAVAGTTAYNLPNDASRIHIITYVDASGYNYGILEYLDRHNFDVRSSGAQSTPAIYTTWGNPGSTAGDFSMTVYPAPSDAGTFTVYYYSRPTDLALDGSAIGTELSLPAGWHDLVVDYVEAKALRKDRDNRWREAWEFFQMNLASLAESSNRYSDAAGRWGLDAQFGAPAWLVGYDEFGW